MNEYINPSPNIEDNPIWAFKHDIEKCRKRLISLEGIKEPSVNDLKEIGKLEFYKEILKVNYKVKFKKLCAYKAQLALNNLSGDIEVFFNGEKNKEHQQVKIGVINKSLEFEQTLMVQQLKSWDNKTGTYMNSKVQLFDDIFYLSEEGIITYDNSSKGLKKEIVNLRTLDFEG